MEPDRPLDLTCVSSILPISNTTCNPLSPAIATTFLSTSPAERPVRSASAVSVRGALFRSSPNVVLMGILMAVKLFAYPRFGRGDGDGGEHMLGCLVCVVYISSAVACVP